ncbi:MAG TPA: energy transducer TonB [Thiotrichales bacterium]|nr:energy transducer TonB [Thiotrichales bacterium]
MSRKRVSVKPDISDHDRFGMTFLLASIFHGMLILGITFTFSPDADSETAPALDIVLLQTYTPSEADEARFLAQVSQQGGGDSQENTRPRDLFSAPTLAKNPGLAMQTRQQQQRQQQQSEQLALLHQVDATYQIQQNDEQNTPENQNRAEQTQVNETLQTARFAAEISDKIEAQAQSGKVKFLNSSTREFAPAKYMRDWIDRVERVGNLNYPDQARRQKLNGTLILDVVISADGELLKTDLRQSSGHQVLDDAAKRIVRLAAPYSAFPAKLREQADVIHITRSWEFLDSSGLHTH